MLCAIASTYLTLLIDGLEYPAVELRTEDAYWKSILTWFLVANNVISLYPLVFDLKQLYEAAVSAKNFVVSCNCYRTYSSPLPVVTIPHGTLSKSHPYGWPFKT